MGSELALAVNGTSTGQSSLWCRARSSSSSVGRMKFHSYSLSSACRMAIRVPRAAGLPFPSCFPR